MARHTHYEAAPNDDPALDISSLIDVTFLLLIYFLVTSIIQVRETDLWMQPATRLSEVQPRIDPMLIKLDSSGTISVGADAATQVLDSDASVRGLPLLSAHLEMYASAARGANDRPLVQFWADNGTTQQRVVDVLNALAAAGIQAVTFTEPGD